MDKDLRDLCNINPTDHHYGQTCSDDPIDINDFLIPDDDKFYDTLWGDSMEQQDCLSALIPNQNIITSEYPLFQYSKPQHNVSFGEFSTGFPFYSSSSVQEKKQELARASDVAQFSSVQFPSQFSARAYTIQQAEALQGVSEVSDVAQHCSVLQSSSHYWPQNAMKHWPAESTNAAHFCPQYAVDNSSNGPSGHLVAGSEITQFEPLNAVPEKPAFYPPGVRFTPSDNELILHYLIPKTKNLKLPCDLIRSVELYRLSPEELVAGISNEETAGIWYFFTPRDRKYFNGERPDRCAGRGYWKATCADFALTDEQTGKVIGFTRGLVYHIGKQPFGHKTGWMMQEYTIMDPEKKQRSLTKPMLLDSCVLCKVFFKDKKETEKADPSTDDSQSGSQNIILRNKQLQIQKTNSANRDTTVATEMSAAFYHKTSQSSSSPTSEMDISSSASQGVSDIPLDSESDVLGTATNTW